MAKANNDSIEADAIIKKPENTRLQTYLSDIKWNLGWWYLAIIGVFVLFYVPIESVLNAVFIQTIFKFCPKNSYAVDFVISLFFALALMFFHQKLQKGLLINGNSLILILGIEIVYFVFFRSDPLSDFYTFQTPILNHIAYWDLALPAFLLLTTTYKSYQKSLLIPISRNSLIEDTPSLENYDDGYSRAGYARQISNHINETTTKNSFAIGIIGEWGSGKTDFLMRLKENLIENTDNLVFDFNPWRVSKSDAIVEEFFKTLSNKIKPFNQSITEKIKDYSKRVLQTGKEIQYRFFDTILNEWIGNENIEKQYLTINKAISETGKRWVIVIDDVDRLTGKEIMQVLRIVRNTANFANTFFIIAIDQQYVVDALKNAKEFANEEEYLKKVFQLTITLPAFKKQIFIPQLKSLLITEDMSRDEQDSIISALSNISTNFDDLSVAAFPTANHDDVLEKMVDNVRDLKRFSNSFKIAYNILRGEVDIHDLMVLELIRNRNLEVYNLIRDKSLLDFDIDHRNEYTLNVKAFEEFCSLRTATISIAEFARLKTAINYLIKDNGHKNLRKFKSSYNFYLYFSYQLFNLISINEFNNLLEKTSTEISTTFTAWSQDGKRSELFRVVQQLTDFKSEEFFLKIIIGYLNVEIDHEIWLQQVTKLVFSLRRFNEKKYFENDVKKHQTFLRGLMNNDQIKVTDRASIAASFRSEYDYRKSNPDAILSKAAWMKILKNLLDFHLSQARVIDSTALSMLYYNIDHIHTDNKALLSKPALTSFKKALLSNKVFFENYVALQLRPYSQPYSRNGFLVMEPFLEQIFLDWQKFKNQLQKAVFSEPSAQRHKKIILKYIDEFFNSGKRAFKIEDREDGLFIDKWMVDHGNAIVINQHDDDFAEDVL